MVVFMTVDDPESGRRGRAHSAAVQHERTKTRERALPARRIMA
jgi:hypothetical protein